jgi:RNA polymerase sigma factor (TIGR02999 family)
MKIRSRAYTRLVAEPVERTTRLLQAAERGDPGSEQELFEVLYEDLKRVAGRLLAQERASHTLQATALVHEAWLRLVDARMLGPGGRGRFLSIAARAMRRILVEHARARKRLKRGGMWRRVDMVDQVADPGAEDEILGIDGELDVLDGLSERQARIVEMRYFTGLSSAEAADALGISERTVEREWRFARAWLFDRLARKGPDQR